VDFALGEGDFDFVFAEFFFDGEEDVAAEAGGAVGHGDGPDGEFEVEGAVAESQQAHRGGGFFEDGGVFRGDFEEEGVHFFEVAAVGDADGEADAHFGVAVAPVGDGVGDEVGVGDDDGDVVVGDDGGAAEVDVGDLAGDAADFDAVSDGDGPFREDDQSADEVADDVLEAEPDADAERAEDDGEGAEVEVDEFEDKEEAEDEEAVAGESADGVLEVDAEVGAGEQAFAEESPQVSLGDEDEDEQDDQFDDGVEGEVVVAEFDQRVVEDVEEVRPSLVQWVVHDWFLALKSNLIAHGAAATRGPAWDVRRLPLASP